jgi:hypothetical protein
MTTPSKLALLVLLTLAPLAHAGKDITFNVPVKLEKLDPLVGSLMVVCGVLNDQNQVLTMATSPTVAVQNGAYQGNQAITFNIPDDKLGLVKKWNCSLRIMATSGGNWFAFDTYGAHWTKASPGAVAEQSGNF